MTVLSDPRGTSFAHLYGIIGHVRNAAMLLREAFAGRIMFHIVNPSMVSEQCCQIGAKALRPKGHTPTI